MVGRIVQVTDASGSEVRAYDRLGQMVEETKTVASHTQGNCDNCPEVWTTHYLYDTWGRLQQMTYPDGEVLTYAYDSGGLPRAATGVKLGVTTPYVQRFEYDEFGQHAFLRVGNGAETTYAYNPINRRLARLTAGDFQDLHYSYDLVGNITALSNQVPIPVPSAMGGPVDQTFAYDGLYRLTQATGQWRFSNKHQDYALSLAYDTIHNLTRKTQSDSVTTPGGSTVPQKLTTYDFAYAYAGHGPHQSTTIGDHAFSYDANGNQTGWNDLTSGKRRTIVWNEENRVQQISDNGQTTSFVYDDSGQRVIKRGKQGETAYINQFWTVRNRSVGTKHIFVGDTRIASKVIPGSAHLDPHSNDPFTSVLGQWWQQRAAQGWQNGTTTVKNPHFAGNAMPDILPEDNFIYFYHPDHLGSTSFATAATGDLFEHLEYFPFGETWVSEQTNTQRLPFLFTSKELDEETQLYYFGARYYDPRTSVWQSADPILATYLQGMPQRGVLEPGHLALYSYALNNPIVFKDLLGAFESLGDPLPSNKQKPSQLSFSLSHPLAAIEIGKVTIGSNTDNISTNAVRFSTRIGLDENAEHQGSEVNAFRHTIWQATIASKFGPDIARSVGFAHEDELPANLNQRQFTGRNALTNADTTVDLLNNILGRNLAEANQGKTPQQLSIAALDYFHTQGLFTATKQANGTVTVSQTRISDAKYNNALGILNGLNDKGFTASEQAAIDAQMRALMNNSIPP